jgi:dynein heavy chain
VPVNKYYYFIFHILEKLKLGLTIETKAWRVHYGKACNQKYSSEMEEMFEFIEDLNKKLSRPLKDLDDIRFAMQSLKDIRENEIKIDMGITPIEVSLLNNQDLNRNYSY